MKYFLQYKHKCVCAKAMTLRYVTLFKWMKRCYYKNNVSKYTQLYLSKWKTMIAKCKPTNECKHVLINRKYKLKPKLRNNKASHIHASAIQKYFKYKLYQHLYTKCVSLIHHIAVGVIVNTLQQTACARYLKVNADIAHGLLWIARMRQLKRIGRKVNDVTRSHVNMCVFRRWKGKTTDIVIRKAIQIQKCIRKHYHSKNMSAHKRLLTILRKHLHKLQYTTEMTMVITLRKCLRKCYYVKYTAPLITVQKVWRGVYIRKYKYKFIL